MVSNREALQQKSLARWRECIEHDMLSKTDSLRWDLAEIAGHGETVTLAVISSWAHEELLERGWTVETREDADPKTVAPCQVRLSKHKHDDGIYEGDTLLDCFLAAIVATEPAKETEDIAVAT